MIFFLKLLHTGLPNSEIILFQLNLHCRQQVEVED